MSDKCAIDVVGVLAIVKRLEERIAALEPKFAVEDRVTCDHYDEQGTVRRVRNVFVGWGYNLDDGSLRSERYLSPAPEPKAPLAERLRTLIGTDSEYGSSTHVRKDELQALLDY